MATLARPGRPLSSSVRRAYRLEMAGRTVALLLGMLALTGLVVFYLGVVTGKGLRDPNQPAPADGAAPAPAAESKSAPAATALNQALTSQTGQIEGLKKDESAANQQTQQLLSRAKQQIEMEEVPAKPAPPANSAATAQPAPQKKAAPTAKPAAARPAAAKPAAAKPAPPVPAGEAYTVQVFSSPQRQSAQDVVSDLKSKGFPAYINAFQAADRRTWYRVRVGKGSKQEAETVAAKLRQQSTLQDLRVLKL
jgi:cell division septation protein DedD